MRKILTPILIVALAATGCSSIETEPGESTKLTQPAVDKWVNNAGISAQRHFTEAGQTLIIDASSINSLKASFFSYKWSLAQKPEGSAAMTTDSNTPVQQIKVDKPGTYEVFLSVSERELEPSNMRFLFVIPDVRSKAIMTNLPLL